MSAVPVIEKVFAGRSNPTADDAQNLAITVTKAGSTPSKGPGDYFTGEVHVSGNYRGNDPARISGATVSFTAGARTAWHTHPLGQTLFIVSGKGWVQKEGGPTQVVEPGDVVWIPPMVKHWHGATAEEPLVHFAVAEALNGSVVTWMEQVSDSQYKSSLIVD
jgi:4-carboxymuconolactone decarboxylase